MVEARDITERSHAPSGVAAFMSAHSKTPYITPSMDFPSGNGVVRGRRGQQLGFALGGVQECVVAWLLGAHGLRLFLILVVLVLVLLYLAVALRFTCSSSDAYIVKRSIHEQRCARRGYNTSPRH